jgi:hypothetical protein
MPRGKKRDDGTAQDEFRMDCGAIIWRIWPFTTNYAPPTVPVRISAKGILLDVASGGWFPRETIESVTFHPGTFGASAGWMGAGFQLNHTGPGRPHNVRFNAWSKAGMDALRQALERFGYFRADADELEPGS